MYPAFPVNFPNPVHPGDHFTGSVTFNGGSSYTLKLADSTQGWTGPDGRPLNGNAVSALDKQIANLPPGQADRWLSQHHYAYWTGCCCRASSSSSPR